MDYRKLSEQTLDEIMRQIRMENGIVQEKAQEEKLPGITRKEEWSLLSPEIDGLEKQLADAVIGTQIGLHKAPMKAKKGIVRKLARVVETIYLRIAELTSRDIREFNSKVLFTLHTFKDLLSKLLQSHYQMQQKHKELEEQQIRLSKIQEELEYKLHTLEGQQNGLREIQQQCYSQMTERFQSFQDISENQSVRFFQQTQGLQEQTQGLQEQTQGLQEQTQGLQEQTQGLQEQTQGLQEQVQELLAGKDSQVEYAQLEEEIKELLETRTAVLVKKQNQIVLEQSAIREQLGSVKSIITWANNETFTQHLVQKLKDVETVDNPLFYHDFEEKFRGTQRDIQERLRVYLPILSEHFGEIKNKKFVDLGCGRGEWLDVLRENGVLDVTGVDLNEIQIAICREKSHAVACQNIFAFLSEQKDESIDVISGFQIIEHFQMEALLALLCECKRVLKSRGMIIFETPNSCNLLTAGVWFYVDPTHEKPIYKEVAKFLVERTGFVDVSIMEVNAAKYVAQLEKPTCFDGNQSIWDENINLLNTLLYGPQDYAVLGVKV